jgi:GT2 family glycosyltransferase
MEPMKISIILVTFNRVAQVQDCVGKNLISGGINDYELVWVDNGSTDGCQNLPEFFKADRIVLNRKNIGVSAGYNQALGLCRTDWIYLIGDRNLLPSGWLKTGVSIANSGLVDSVCMYEVPPLALPDRWLPGPDIVVSGCRLKPALQNGSMIFRRSLLASAGYWREDMGMYGWNDIEWARRIANRNLRGYAMVDHISSHLADDPNDKTMVDGIPYRTWVNRERDHPSKQERLEACRIAGYPHFSPY